MSTSTKRAPGRPKKSPASPVVEKAPEAVAPAVEKAKNSTIKYRQPKKENRGSVFQCIKGGIVYLLPQSGITVFDRDSNQVREIRYCENMPSIYTDEQGEHARRGSITFRDGLLMVPPTKPQLLDYMRLHPGNKANGGSSFFELKPDEKAESTLKNEFDVVDAVALVRDMSISDLLPVAISYGISTTQQPSEIRYALLAHAKSNPTAFMESFDSPAVKSKAAIKQAIDFQILDAKQDGCYWFDSKSLIVACPVGQDPINVMTRFCMTERGASVLMEIEDRLAKLD